MSSCFFTPHIMTLKTRQHKKEEKPMFKLVSGIFNAIELVIGKITTIIFAIFSGILTGGIGMIFLQAWLEDKKPGSISGIFIGLHEDEEPPKEEPKKPKIVRAKRSTKKGGE